MTTIILRRTLTLFTRTSTLLPHLHPFSTTSPPNLQPNRTPKTQTPLEKQFETWTNHLKPGFTPSDLTHALRSQPDTDLAYDIFRWSALQRGYKHSPTSYLTMLHLSLSSRRHRIAETLLDEILAGAVEPSLPLFNSLIRLCTSHRCLFNRSFDVYKKMLSFSDRGGGIIPNLDTYMMLLTVLLKKFSKINVSYVYLNGVKSLHRQMKMFGVVPDTYILNMIIKAYSKCLQVDEAVRVFREMGLYGCEPNRFSYSYLIKGFCEKGRVSDGWRWYREMKEKELVGTSSVYMVLGCSLALERRFEEAVEVLRDMVREGMSPDMLTYRTVLEELCRDGKGNDAVELLQEFRGKDGGMGEKNYRTLMDGVHFVNWD